MKVGVFLRTEFNYDRDQSSRDSGLSMVDADGVLDVGKTQQHFAAECDINTIVERFGLTGQLPEVVKLPMSGDFTGVTDFQSALNAVIEARESFMELPADVRARFSNDPQRLLEFVADPKSRDEGIKLGLFKAPVEPVAPVAPVVAIPPKG